MTVTLTGILKKNYKVINNSLYLNLVTGVIMHYPSL